MQVILQRVRRKYSNIYVYFNKNVKESCLAVIQHVVWFQALSLMWSQSNAALVMRCSQDSAPCQRPNAQGGWWYPLVAFQCI